MLVPYHRKWKIIRKIKEKNLIEFFLLDIKVVLNKNKTDFQEFVADNYGNFHVFVAATTLVARLVALPHAYLKSDRRTIPQI